MINWIVLSKFELVQVVDRNLVVRVILLSSLAHWKRVIYLIALLSFVQLDYHRHLVQYLLWVRNDCPTGCPLASKSIDTLIIRLAFWKPLVSRWKKLCQQCWLLISYMVVVIQWFHGRASTFHIIDCWNRQKHGNNL